MVLVQVSRKSQKDALDRCPFYESSRAANNIPGSGVNRANANWVTPLCTSKDCY